VRQLAVRERAAVLRDDPAVARNEAGAIRLPARGRLIDEDLARRRGGACQLDRKSVV